MFDSPQARHFYEATNTSGEMKRDDKSGILYRDWKAKRPEAALLLVHGLGAHSTRWEFLADFFLKHNISSYAIELRGYGEAVTSKERPAAFKTYLEDINRLYDIIKFENPDKKIFILGESMGAVIAFLEAAARPGLFAGLISISPALKSALKFTLFDYLGIFLPLLYNPEKLNCLPFDYTACTRDAEYLKVIEAERREVPMATSRLLFDIAIAQIKCGILKNRIKTPVLFLIPGKDTVMISDASRAFFKSLKFEDKKLIEYPDMYHAISIDLGREKAFHDILYWLRNRS